MSRTEGLLAMWHTFGHYTQYDGDDGYTTLQLNGRCDVCQLRTKDCDCDSDYASSDRSRNYVKGYD